jgi:type I restriction enzyme, S subunit
MLMDNSMPFNWVQTKLGTICNIAYGKGLPVKELRTEGYPVFGANGIIGFNNEYLYADPQVLISCRGAYSGKINFSPAKCFITNNSLVVVIIDHQLIFNKFLFFALHIANKSKLVSGTAQPQVTINNAIELAILLPPLPEQHRIVAKIEELFSELDKGVEALKTAQQQLKVYRQAVLQRAFEGKLTDAWRKQQKDLPTAPQLLKQIRAEREKQAKATGKKQKPAVPLMEAELAKLPNGWQWVNLADVSTDIFDGPFGSHLKSSDYTDGGVRVIRLENIGALEFNDQYRSYVAKEKYETIKKHTVYPGDIVFSSFISEKIRVALVPSHIQKAVNKADCFCIRTNKIIIGEKYLACFLSTRTAYHQLVNEIHGATRPRINTTQLKSCWIPYCSVEEQHLIVSEIESRLSVADKIEESIVQSLKQAEALRQSILKRAFSGKLVPQDPNDEPAEKLLARIRAKRTAQTPLRSRRRRDSRPEALKRGPLV